MMGCYFLNEFAMLLRPCLLVALSFLVIQSVWSQPVGRENPQREIPAPSRGKPDDPIRWTGNADTDWQMLSEKFRSAGERGRAQAGPGRVDQLSQQDEALVYRSMADDALGFRTRHPNNQRAKEARKLEATALLRAMMVGDETVESRATAVANEVIDDTTLNEDERYQIASRLEMSKSRRFFHDQTDLKRVRLEGARRLMAKFPRHPGGYSNLLSIAESETDLESVISLTEELLHDSVPGEVRQAAQVVHDRAKLPGKPLATLMRHTLGHADYLEGMKDKVVVLYTWAEWSPGSLQQARELMILAPEKVEYLGLRVGDSSPAAQSLVASEQLPGEQITGTPAQLLAFARALNTGGLLPFYIIAPDGNIALVSNDLRGLSEKVRQLHR